MENLEAFKNRLRKRSKHLQKFAKRWPTTAYRVYDRDIPEFPFLVDRYDDAVYVQELLTRKTNLIEDVAPVGEAICEVLDIDPSRLVYAQRKRGDGAARYQQGFDQVVEASVTEDSLRFAVRIGEHIDTGLFCDHRNLRRAIGSEEGEGRRLLNLFAYTGAFSVWAARAGFLTTTVDLSNTYLQWAAGNFRENDLDPTKHRFERSDATRFLSQEFARGERYDVIVLDPPSYSKSKKMVSDFDVQRDHAPLIVQAMRLMPESGVLYFSNNLRTFEIEKEKLRSFDIEEISAWTRSEDFPKNSHRAWRITHAKKQDEPAK